MHFGFTNMEWKVHCFWVISSWKVRNVSETPCILCATKMLNMILAIFSLWVYVWTWEEIQSSVQDLYQFRILHDNQWWNVVGMQSCSSIKDGLIFWKLFLDLCFVKKSNIRSDHLKIDIVYWSPISAIPLI